LLSPRHPADFFDSNIAWNFFEAPILLPMESPLLSPDSGSSVTPPLDARGSPSSGATAASSLQGINLVATPMELPTSARPTYFVHPLLFYRHCFRLTSQNDRVPRVLVMSEHYISYLCAPDGRATWSFHPSTVKSVHIMPTRDQALFTFRHHSTDLLLHFDEKLAADRINPPMATLSYFLFLICRESVDIVVKEEDDLSALRRSNLIKSSDQKGAEGFVRRLVDGLRGYYLLLLGQIEDVKEELEQYKADHPNGAGGGDSIGEDLDLLAAGGSSSKSHAARMLLISQRRRSASLAAIKVHPLQVRSLHTVSNPVGYLHRRTPDTLGMRDHKHFCVVVDGELPLPKTAFRGLIVFYRRGATVTIDIGSEMSSSTGGIFTPEVVDRIGILNDHSINQKHQRLPLLHQTSRVGDVFVDSYGFVYFLPNKQQHPRHVPPTPITRSPAELEVIAFLPTVAESILFKHESVRERALRNNHRLHHTPSYARLNVGRSTASRMSDELVKRLQTGSWAAVTLAPPDDRLLRRRLMGQRDDSRSAHAGQDARDHEYDDDNDGGEAVVNGDFADDRHPSSLIVPFTTARDADHMSTSVLSHEYPLRSLRDLKDLEELSSGLHRFDTAANTSDSPSGRNSTNHSPHTRVGGDIGSSAIEAFDMSALTIKAAQYTEAIRREQSGMFTTSAANDVLSRWIRVVVVVDFDAASAAQMTPTDSAVSSVEVLVDLCETLRFSAVEEFSLSSSNTNGRCGYQKTLINSADVREARRKDRDGARRDRTSKRTALLSVDQFDEVEAFVDSRAILNDMLSEYGAPWTMANHKVDRTRHGAPRHSSSLDDVSSFATVVGIDSEPTMTSSPVAAVRTPHDRQQGTLQKLVWLSCEQARNRWRTL
jgi:hypothetical protein